jgi:hypothetical protein
MNEDDAMRNARFSYLLIFATVCLLLAACQPAPLASSPTAQPVQSQPVQASPTVQELPPSTSVPAPAGIDLEMLRGAAYPVENVKSGTAQLVNGEYREPAAQDSSTQVVVQFNQAAFGDLNQDGAQDAAVILMVDGGGTGRFFYLYAALAQNSSPLISSPIYLGDRTKIDAMEIVDGMVKLQMVKVGPNDPMCCPSQPVNEAYRYDGGGLVLITP